MGEQCALETQHTLQGQSQGRSLKKELILMPQLDILWRIRKLLRLYNCTIQY